MVFSTPHTAHPPATKCGGLPNLCSWPRVLFASTMAASFSDLPSSITSDIVERVRLCCPAAFRSLEQTSRELQNIVRSVTRCLCLQSASNISASNVDPETAARMICKELQLRPQLRHVKLDFEIQMRNKAYIEALLEALRASQSKNKTVERGWICATVTWQQGFMFEPPNDVYPLDFLGEGPAILCNRLS
jgi:hypothetical protein